MTSTLRFPGAQGFTMSEELAQAPKDAVTLEPLGTGSLATVRGLIRTRNVIMCRTLRAAAWTDGLACSTRAGLAARHATTRFGS